MNLAPKRQWNTSRLRDTFLGVSRKAMAREPVWDALNRGKWGKTSSLLCTSKPDPGIQHTETPLCREQSREAPCPVASLWDHHYLPPSADSSLLPNHSRHLPTALPPWCQA